MTLVISRRIHLVGYVEPTFLAIILGSPLWTLGVGTRVRPQEFAANALPQTDGQWGVEGFSMPPCFYSPEVSLSLPPANLVT